MNVRLHAMRASCSLARAVTARIAFNFVHTKTKITTPIISKIIRVHLRPIYVHLCLKIITFSPKYTGNTPTLK